MSNDISSMQNQFQNDLHVHHGGGGHGKKRENLRRDKIMMEKRKKIYLA